MFNCLKEKKISDALAVYDKIIEIAHRNVDVNDYAKAIRKSVAFYTETFNHSLEETYFNERDKIQSPK